MKLQLSAILLACCVTGFGQGQGNGNGNGPGEGQGPPEIVPHRTNPHETAAPTVGSAGVITPPIAFHGGPVLNAPTVYLIWYGNWNQSNNSDTPSGQAIVRDFVHGLTGSNYYMTNATYTSVSGSLIVGGIGNGSNSGYGTQEITDSYSQGTNLSDNQIAAIVSKAVSTSGWLGSGGDANGIYLVLTSSDVNETSGFCTKYCGWHTRSGTITGANGHDIKYAFVGNANRCLNACAAQTVSPNGNPGVDGMVSVIAHETEESNTDPDLNAWYNRKGSEDADMCAWTFGSQQTRINSGANTGAYYNMLLPAIATGTSRPYLVQRELSSASKCYVSYPNVQ